MEKKRNKRSINIVIPVYNEETELEKSVMTLIAYLREHLTDFNWFITIADNASTDNTFDLARSLARRNHKVHALHLDQKGRGRAVKHAWMKEKSDLVAYMDVDLSTDLKHFPPLVRSLQR